MADTGASVVPAPIGGVSLPTKDGLKRFRSQSTAEFKATPSQQDESLAQPLLAPHFHEPMVQYLHRLQGHVREEYGGVFAAVNSITEDGIYIHKRPVRVLGDALGQTAVLQQAGSVFHHVVLYVKAGDQLAALDYGPEGDVDMTSNWTQAVPCGPVLNRSAEPPSTDGGDLALLHVRAPHHAIDHEAVHQAIEFVGSRKYHAILNNCMQNCDLLVRVMTGGLVRDAPLVYDVVCGQMPQQESPLLLMFLLMTKMSWFQVCDAASQVTAYLSQHTCPAPLEGLGPEFAPHHAAGPNLAHRDKLAKGEASGTSQDASTLAPESSPTDPIGSAPEPSAADLKGSAPEPLATNPEGSYPSPERSAADPKGSAPEPSATDPEGSSPLGVSVADPKGSTPEPSAANPEGLPPERSAADPEGSAPECLTADPKETSPAADPKASSPEGMKENPLPSAADNRETSVVSVSEGAKKASAGCV